MVYFTDELIAEMDRYSRFEHINEDDFQKRWNQACSEYAKSFEALRPSLPKEFFEFYIESEYLHDAEIDSIDISSAYKKHSYPLQAVINGHTYRDRFCIKYIDATAVSFSLDNTCEMWYLYGEILKNGKTLSHEFLTENGSVKIEFARIQFSKYEVTKNVQA